MSEIFFGTSSHFLAPVFRESKRDANDDNSVMMVQRAENYLCDVKRVESPILK